MSSHSGIEDGLSEAAAQIKVLLKREQSGPVSVGLLGIGGAGKSSLVNAIVGKDIMEVGVGTDATIDAQEAEYNGVKYTDLPGFGTKGFPGKDFEDKEFDVKGGKGRKVRIDDFDVLLCVSHVKFVDEQPRLFRRALNRSKAALFVASQSDAMFQKGLSQEELETQRAADVRKQLQDPKLPVYFVSTRTGRGIDQLQTAIYNVLDVAKRERWAKGVHAYSAEFLALKRKSCENMILRYCAGSAANGFNPVPGVSEAVDVGVMLAAFREIRLAYGMSPQRLAWLESHAGAVAARVASRVAVYAGPLAADALLALLKRFAGRMAAREISRYIPVVGQIVAASIGFGVTYWAAHQYLDECEELAKRVLDESLEMPTMEPEQEDVSAYAGEGFSVRELDDGAIEIA